MITSGVFLVFATAGLAYTVDALLVGMALALIRSRSESELSGYTVIAALFAIFVVLDVAALPALSALDATVHIGNAPLAEWLGATGEGVRLTTLLEFELLDSLVWAAQTLAALWVAAKFSGPTRPTRAAA